MCACEVAGSGGRRHRATAPKADRSAANKASSDKANNCHKRYANTAILYAWLLDACRMIVGPRRHDPYDGSDSADDSRGQPNPTLTSPHTQRTSAVGGPAARRGLGCALAASLLAPISPSMTAVAASTTLT